MNIDDILDKLDRANRVANLVDARFVGCFDDCRRFERPSPGDCTCGGERLRQALADWRADNG